MMPLTLATVGEKYLIRRIGGKQEVRKHLEHLGFTTGAQITVVSTGGNLIERRHWWHQRETAIMV